MSSKLINELTSREILKQVTDNDKLEKAVSSKAAFYLGIDPTGHSLHLGHYISLNLIKILSKYGLKPILVFGGATGMIGDPSGKSAERNLLDTKTIERNVKAISSQVSKVLDGVKFDIVNNYDFYKDMNIISFLRDIGKHINIAELIHRDMIKNRLETGLSFTEFSYSLLQGNDFLTLYKNKNCQLQIGGSDQWGNILTGLDLIKKFDSNANAVGLTINLLLDETGNKFGKTSTGKTMFIEESLTSPYEMYQFLFNLSDDKATELIKKLTMDTFFGLDKLIEQHKANPSKRILQHELAKDIFENIYSKGEFEKAVALSTSLFKEEYNSINLEALKSIAKTFEVINTKELTLIDAFANLEDDRKISKTNYRKLLLQGAIKLNGVSLKDENIKTKDLPFLFDKYLFVKIGKKHFVFVK